MISCALVHIGKNLPEYFFDCIYQSLLINHTSSKLYIIVDDSLVDIVKNKISKFNLDYYFNNKFYFTNLIEVISINLLNEILLADQNYKLYNDTLIKFNNVNDFRDGFWISTTARFFYIGALMKLLHLENVFHIENDIVLYESFINIYNHMKEINYIDENDKHKIWAVQDSFSPPRVVPSILFFPNIQSNELLTEYITSTLYNSDRFLNDMDILGSYNNKVLFPIFPEKELMYFDGAAIGQYLGGVDFKNLNKNDKDPLFIQYDNPTVGFINETSNFKPNNYKFTKTFIYTTENSIPLKIYTSNSTIDNKIHTVSNLHIHSKQLYQFNSLFDIGFNDIITGDRVVNLCDFIITIPEIFDFHKNIDIYTKNFDISKVIIIKNIDNINFNLLNKYFKNHSIKNNTDTIKLFVYTHLLDFFTNKILNNLDKSLKYVIYAHNSDHSVNISHKKLIDHPNIKKIYAQNLDYPEKISKLQLLPIGLANAMWPHGNLLKLYTVIKNTYFNIKNNSIYVNINPKTYKYRSDILNKILEKNVFILSSGKPYEEYLEELSSHRFCLCIRGNGIDTHRFWESLYLGVIPVIINNNITKCDNFVKYLNDLDIPFVEIKENNLDKMFDKFNNDYFSEDLYKKLLQKYNNSIYNIKSLKVSFYN